GGKGITLPPLPTRLSPQLNGTYLGRGPWSSPYRTYPLVDSWTAQGNQLNYWRQDASGAAGAPASPLLLQHGAGAWRVPRRQGRQRRFHARPACAEPRAHVPAFRPCPAHTRSTTTPRRSSRAR